MTTFLTPHFSLEELVISQTASRLHLDNTPPAEVLERMTDALAPGLERVRQLLGGLAISVDSGYRSPAVNKAVGGVANSAHIFGWAADLICPAFGDPLAICRVVAGSPLIFDQLIEEGTWVHVSFDTRARRQILTKAPGGGYRDGLPPI